MKSGNFTNSLRRGWTTGACAMAATTAACTALATGNFPKPVTIILPGGQMPSFNVIKTELRKDFAGVSIIKDAGDDPDITDGAEIRVEVQISSVGSGITFKAGSGVGIATLPGLPIPVGAPAINPAPQKMIESAVTSIANKNNGLANVEITISIIGGEKLAKKTMNPRLGIKGGLSILGTTGIVIPYSCASWIHAIHRGIDVAHAQGLCHLLAATGSTSEKIASQAYPSFPEQATIDMGDFVGGMLKYLRKHPVQKLTLVGGFAKLTKLADGALDLHSSRSTINFNSLAQKLAALGASSEIVQRTKSANTAMEVLELAKGARLPLANTVAVRAREVALAVLSGGTDIEVIVINRDSQRVGLAGFKENA